MEIQVNTDARVRLHPLAVRSDSSESIVGRVETGEFIALPYPGRRALELLSDGLCISDARSRLHAELGEDLDLAEFVAELCELGFVASLDDRRLDQPSVPPPTLAWISPRHVRWTLHPLTGLVIASLVLIAAGILAARPALVPTYHDLVWRSGGTLAILGDAILGWTILALHELGHLCTARAAGAPARMSFGTRLQFLVVQTDVSGIWAAERRVRYTVYLAGIAVELVLASTAVLVRALLHPHGLLAQLASALAAVSLLGAASQAMFFMRTDLYFLLQDLTGARNLYADSSRYLGYRLGRLLRRHDPNGRPDPTGSLPPSERRAVVAYGPVLVLGTAACLALAAAITVPATATVLAHAIGTFRTKPAPGPLVNAATTVLLIGTVQLLWARAWWRRHADQARAAVRRIVAIARSA